MNELINNGLEMIKSGEISREVIYTFLCIYYEDYLRDIVFWEDAPFPEELTLPLIERPSGIYEALQWLSERKYDMNEGEDFNPLMEAVSYADAPMTEFLIQNGANANYWPGMEETPEYMRGNFYLEDIDIAYFNEDWPRNDHRYVQALLQTARVLVEIGNTGSFKGLCLEANAEERTVTLSGPRYKY